MPEIFTFPQQYPTHDWFEQARNGNIPHAQMVVCENGGLGWLAVQRYIQTILCGSGGCGSCDVCRQHHLMVHPDVHYVFPVVGGSASVGTSDVYISEFRNYLTFNKFPLVRGWIDALDAAQKVVQISVKEAKRMGDLLHLKSHSGGYKVMLVWLPERMHESAANKLLKTLEEPEKNTVIILLTHAEEEVLGTIRSRCQTLYLPPWGNAEVEKWLIGTRKMDSIQAKILASLSAGSPGIALDFLENRERLIPLAAHFVEWMRLAFKKDLPGLQVWVDGVGGWSREQQRDFLVFSGQLLSQLTRLRHNALRGFALQWFPEVSFQPAGFAKLLTPRNILLLHKTLDDAFVDIGRNINPRLVFFDSSLLLMKAF
ncbi:MAG: hypothetical protein ABR88_03060 [Cryomorphaceae bacterium BACL7 MAG-120322-bin74]|nr:MAG: hypothetical protein ABR88_03060 [Cryomorphaceae bacterium BACL7 MAG-120322-bin74]KRO83054.1 MAG: hypothetical protein ABR87_03685 [Cryomorphaceae bacterium BACL7 MAG-121220-bin83]